MDDVQRLDLELDHLCELGLLVQTGGFQPYLGDQATPIAITASALAMHLYVRCQGFVGPPADYFAKEVAAAKDATSSVAQQMDFTGDSFPKPS
jgi:hypothetical protein